MQLLEIIGEALASVTLSVLSMALIWGVILAMVAGTKEFIKYLKKK